MARSISNLARIYPGSTAQSPVSTIGGPVQGAGVSNTSGQGVTVMQLFGNLKGSVLGAPLTWLFGLIGLLVLYKLVEEHRGGREGFSEIKIGLNNLVKVTLFAVVGIVIGKFLFTKYDVPGLSPLFKAA